MKKLIYILLIALIVALTLIGIFFHTDIQYAVRLHSKSGPASVYKWLRYYQPSWSEANIAWDKAIPANKSRLATKLNELTKHLAQKDTQAFLIIHNGKIIQEWYRPGRGPNMLHYMAALGKAVTASAVLAISLDDDRIRLHDKISADIPAWKDDLQKSKITVWHLATHSSGMERIPLSNFPDSKKETQQWIHEYKSARDKRFALSINKAQILFEPGTHYSYSGVGYYVLGYILAKHWQQQPNTDLSKLLKERIMQPLGIPDSAWRISYGENYQYKIPNLYAIGSGGSYTPRAIARIGQLFLNKGQWDHRQLISRASMDMLLNKNNTFPMRKTDNPGPAAVLGWWSNANQFFHSLPKDALIGAGAGHQILLVVPSLNLVAVRMGGSLNGIRQWEGMYWRALEQQFFTPLMDTISNP